MVDPQKSNIIEALYIRNTFQQPTEEVDIKQLPDPRAIVLEHNETKELKDGLDIDLKQTFLAEHFNENLKATLAFQLSNACLSKSELNQKFESDFESTPLFAVTLKEFIPNYDSNSITTITDKILSLSIDDQHILFLAAQLDDLASYAIRGDEQERQDNSLPFIMVLAKHHLDGGGNTKNQDLYNNFIEIVKTQIALQPEGEVPSSLRIVSGILSSNISYSLQLLRCLVAAENFALSYFLVLFGPKIDVSKSKADASKSKLYEEIFNGVVQNDWLSIVELLIHKGAEYSTVDERGNYPLLIAFEKNSSLMMRLLQKNGLTFWDQVKVLEKAIQKSELDLPEEDKENNINTIKLLTNSLIYYKPKDSLVTPLHMAALTGSMSVMELLINKGVDLNVQDDKGYTPLMNTVFFNEVKAMKLLLEKKANPDLVNNTGRTALHMAILNSDDHDIINLLINDGASTDTVDNDGLSPLLAALFKNKPDLAEILINKGVDLNAVTKVLLQTSYGTQLTPLHLAAQLGYTEVTKLLIEKNADLDARSSKHYTALSIALLEKRPEIAKLILEAKNEKASSANLKGNLESVDFRWSLNDETTEFNKCYLNSMIRPLGKIYPNLFNTTSLGGDQANFITKASAEITCNTLWTIHKINQSKLLNAAIFLPAFCLEAFNLWSKFNSATTPFNIILPFNIIRIFALTLPIIISYSKPFEAVFGKYFTSFDKVNELQIA